MCAENHEDHLSSPHHRPAGARRWNGLKSQVRADFDLPEVVVSGASLTVLAPAPI